MSREAGRKRMFKDIQKKFENRFSEKITAMPEKVKEKFKLRKIKQKHQEANHTTNNQGDTNVRKKKRSNR